MSKVHFCHIPIFCSLVFFLFLLPFSLVASPPNPVVHLSAFKTGNGPVHSGGIYRLLNGSGTPGQSNAVAFDVAEEDAFEEMKLHFKLRVLEGGDGGAFVLLNTTEYGKRGPAPFVKSWVEPNFIKTFAVGIDVHNPPDSKPFKKGGNYQGLPEREVSLHWDGREIVKRVAPAEFRGDFAECKISVQHVIGGAEITVHLAGETVYDRYFLAGMLPYESRLAIGAGTRDDVTTEFDVQDIIFTKNVPASQQRTPKHIKVFNHVMNNNTVKSYKKKVTLPPLDWAYGRIILTLEIHDAKPDWDTWDRDGHLYVINSEGDKLDIVPFITSYQTPCYWTVDVTHFRPLLTGEVNFELAATTPGEDRGFMMSMSLDFYHGTPELEPFQVLPLWVGTAKYGSADNHFTDFFNPQTVNIDASTEAARLFITTTGHTQVGEFTPSRRTVTFAKEKGGEPAAEQRFENTLWKDDCYLNPIRPQRGTWMYARAGWAPGDIVRPWWIDLTPYIIPGKTAELRYKPEPYDFTEVPEEKQPKDDEINQAIHVVRSYLILYRTPKQLVDAPTLEVFEVLADSNAADAGILVGDFVDSYNGMRPDTLDSLRAAIKAAEAEGKEKIEVVIYRATERMEIEIGPGQMGVKINE